MFWLGVLIGLFIGTTIGFLAAGLCGIVARQELEDGDRFLPEGPPLRRQEPNCRECG
jgi:hypothetical protein